MMECNMSGGKKVVDGSLQKSPRNFKVSSQDRAIDMLVAQRFITKKPTEMALREVTKYSHSEDFFTDIIRNFGSLEFLRNSEICIAMHLLNKLKLEPGMSFLCISCDMGFMNAVAGLIIGPNGANHGVCFNSNKAKEAKKFVDNFASNSEIVSQFGFCVPEIQTFNALTLKHNKYDRMFCGRAATVNDLLWLLKPGGRAVIVHQNSWRVAIRNFMPHVTCKLINRVNVIDTSDLPRPNEDDQSKFPVVSPTTLLNTCRAIIQSNFTATIERECGLPESRPSLVEYIEEFKNVPYLKDLVLNKVAREVEGMELPTDAVGTRSEQNKINQYEKDVKLYMERNSYRIPFSQHMRRKISQINHLPQPVMDFLAYKITRSDKL